MLFRPKRRLQKASTAYKLEQKSDHEAVDSNSSLVASVPYKLLVKAPSMAVLRGVPNTKRGVGIAGSSLITSSLEEPFEDDQGANSLSN